MRTVIVCLALILASWGAAAEQAKPSKKVAKTVLVKPVSKPKGKPAANQGTRKAIKPAASKPNHGAAQKRQRLQGQKNFCIEGNVRPSGSSAD